jgi:hypothetical protein
MMTTVVPLTSRSTLKGLVGWLAGAALLLPALARADEEAARQAPAPAQTAPAPGAAASAGAHKPPPHRAGTLSSKAREHFRAAWGVDGLKVSRTASGNLIRFTYRVTDPAQAAPLVDRKATPVLYAPRTRAMLSVPVMDKVGPLRQTGTLKAGQEYWIAFSNKGNLVRPGDRVNVIVGRFHADGLVVESPDPAGNPQQAPSRNAT